MVGEEMLDILLGGRQTQLFEKLGKPFVGKLHNVPLRLRMTDLHHTCSCDPRTPRPVPAIRDGPGHPRGAQCLHPLFQAWPIYPNLTTRRWLLPPVYSIWRATAIRSSCSNCWNRACPPTSATATATAC